MRKFEGIRYPILGSAEINKHQIGLSLSTADEGMLEVDTT